MSYAIVMFSHELTPLRLYTLQSAYNSPYNYSTPSRSEAVDMCDRAASAYSVREVHPVFYAVFDIGRDDTPTNELASLRPWERWGPPVYVPALCARLASWLGVVAGGLGLAPINPRLSNPWDYVSAPSRLSDILSAYAPDPIAIDLDDTSCDVPCPPAALSLVPVVRFEVRSGEVGTDRDNWGSVADFASGRDAAAYVSQHKASYAANGKALVIVKVELEAVPVAWREREALRLTDGAYTPLPSEWADAIALAYPDHFPHVAQSDKRKVAFTESDGSGERDKQKVLSAAAYVARFFTNGGGGGYDYWYSDRRHRFVSDMLGSSIVPLFAPLGDVAAMIKVYRDCDGGNAHGCMSHGLGSFNSHIHPVSVYAMGGELTVALLRGYGDNVPEGEDRGSLNTDAAWDSSGPVLARCLVWSRDGEAQGFGRLYDRQGSGHAQMLKSALEALGYRNDDCHGARIAKVQAEGRRSDVYVMPYLDIGSGTVDDCGDHFTVGGDYQAQQTDGLMQMVERESCVRCEESCDEDEMRTVHISSDETEHWCDDCRQGSAFYCEHMGAYVHDDYRADYRPSGSRYSEAVADWLLTDGTISAVVDDNGDWWEDGFTCEDCGGGFAPSLAIAWGAVDTGDASHSEGDVICDSCADERQALADALDAEAAEAA